MTTDTTQPAAPTSHPTSTSTTSAAVPIPTSTSNPHPRSVPLARTSSASSSVSGGIPTRHRPANVAELHQELEREQEGVVNRLLGQITRVAQNVAATHPGTNPDDIAAAAVPLSASPQLAAPIHSGPPGHHHHPPSVTDMPSSFSPAIGRSRSPAPSGHHGYGGGYHHNTSHSRHNSLSTRSRNSSRTSSPLLLPVGMESSVWPQTANDPFLMGGRDEVAFYKAETDMLLRENEMLKRRIKELEDKASGKTEGSTSSANVPAASSESKENTPAGTA
ncbi:hypothetical protein TWF225_005085 [Orbilia oligospora]|uniref:Uncharacterized protein n=1 Tax=Orbilia oligospora TaxID=2813651 RepID=A0A4Z0X9E5_ORBOL|nr:hypothetical protein TWF788_008018 [Orbilia oligospora]KAF3184064.1 hypothetical protein TWF751_000069 [Orbilia oligospora]KAF3185696.1 hypothetical protein TWF225_005085 [Orbilia oligospora]KAF3200048.1 hypothetical protein TWF106_003489 [Orbilia oligospora]KAF3201865.1 hypothetical protein TWF191_003220 [Orbilia oligospora]